MLTLSIKKEWFDMINEEKKLHEYRDIKPYYTIRFKKLFDFEGTDEEFIQAVRDGKFAYAYKEIMFRNGYSSSSPSIIKEVNLIIGTGHEKWGAEPNKEYYILAM